MTETETQREARQWNGVVVGYYGAEYASQEYTLLIKEMARAQQKVLL
jgi:hypothetical protein